MSKWYLNDLDIFEYEQNEIVSKNHTENGEDGIGNFERRKKSRKRT